jgi:hypothetical protein
MSMWRVTPKRWYSSQFVVTDEANRQVGEVRLRPWLQCGSVTAGGIEHRVHRDGLMGGAFVLEEAGQPIAKAVGRSALRQAVTVVWKDTNYLLTARSPWVRDFTLWDGERQIGRLVPERVLGRRVRAEIQDDAPLEVSLFVVWLAEMFWKRGYESHWWAWGTSIPWRQRDMTGIPKGARSQEDRDGAQEEKP